MDSHAYPYLCAEVPVEPECVHESHLLLVVVDKDIVAVVPLKIEG